MAKKKKRERARERDMWQIKLFIAKYIKTRMYEEHSFVYSGFYSLCSEPKQLHFPTLLQKLVFGLLHWVGIYMCLYLCEFMYSNDTASEKLCLSVLCVHVFVSAGFAGTCMILWIIRGTHLDLCTCIGD